MTLYIVLVSHNLVSDQVFQNLIILGQERFTKDSLFELILNAIFCSLQVTVDEVLGKTE